MKEFYYKISEILLLNEKIQLSYGLELISNFAKPILIVNIYLAFHISSHHQQTS